MRWIGSARPQSVALAVPARPPPLPPPREVPARRARRALARRRRSASVLRGLDFERNIGAFPAADAGAGRLSG